MGPVRVVAVSNSAWLRGRGLGKAIDSHDVVIRFNGARTSRVEHDLGSRTTILATSPPIFESELTPARWLLYVPNHLVAPPEAARLERIPGDVEKELAKLMELRPNQFPTTGLAAVWFLLREYRQITLAGWHKGDFANPSSLKTWWDYYHPWDIKKQTTHHDRHAEGEFVSSLIEQGRLSHLA